MCSGCFPGLTHFAHIIHDGLTAEPGFEEKHRDLIARSRPNVRTTPEQTTLFCGGPILTLDNHDLSPVDYLVVDTTGTIAYSGDDKDAAEAAATKEGDYKTHDLDGATIIPGFVEPHVHLVFATLAYEWLLDLNPLAQPRLTDVTNAIKSEIANPKFSDGWVCGFGYDPSRMPLDKYPDLTRDLIDPISRNNPVFVLNSSGHVAYINTATFNLMIEKGYTTWDAIKFDNNYAKDANNNPTGVIFEKAIVTASKLVPFLTKDQFADLADNVLHRWLSRGVTTIFDGGIGVTLLDQVVWPLLKPTAMRLRASVSGILFDPKDTTNWGLGNQVKVTSAKFWADGSTQGYTASLNTPYPDPPQWVVDDPPVFPTSDELESNMAGWYNEGFQLLVHANGDAATDKTLTAYTKLFQSPPTNPNFPGKHRIEHLTVVSEDQVEQIAQTDKLSVSHTIGHVYYWGETFREHIFPRPDPRPPLIDPIAWDIKHGVLWSMHSDSPVTPVDPLLYVRTALTRLTKQNNRILGPEQRVTTLVQALEAVTVNPAIQLGMFDSPKTPTDPLIGTLVQGKQADFVVLGQDPRAVHFEDLHTLPIKETWIGGVRVFSMLKSE